MSLDDRSRHFVRAAALTALLAGAGCSSAVVPAMNKAEGPPASGGAELATVVFVRPDSACDTSDYPTIFDEGEHFVGNAAPSSSFAVHVPPGDHLFVAMPNVDQRLDKYPDFKPVGVVRVNVRAGEVATVAVTIPGGARLRCPKHVWFVLDRRAPSDDEVRHWLSTSQRFEPDAARGEADLQAKRAMADAYFAMAKEKLTARDARREGEKTLPNETREP